MWVDVLFLYFLSRFVSPSIGRFTLWRFSNRFVYFVMIKRIGEYAEKTHFLKSNLRLDFLNLFVGL